VTLLPGFQQERAERVYANDSDVRILFFKVATDAADRPAGAHANHDVGYLPVGLLPDFGTGRKIVTVGVLRIVILVGEDRVGCISYNAVGNRIIGAWIVRGDCGRGDHDF
jgi:hypothetical protein